jgi:hypothetical protein
VIAACERQADGAMGYVVMKVVASFSAETLQDLQAQGMPVTVRARMIPLRGRFAPRVKQTPIDA